MLRLELLALLSKLESVKRGLERWARQIQYNRKEKENMLTSKLSKLMEAERNDDNLREFNSILRLIKMSATRKKGHELIG